MTENGKKFLEKASQDAALQAELQAAQGTALHALLKEKGLEDAAAKASSEAAIKVASAHGFNLTAEDLKPEKLKELSEDELKAVAGGVTCYCLIAGGGTGEGDHCGCAMSGWGIGTGTVSHPQCLCVAGGYGSDGK